MTTVTRPPANASSSLAEAHAPCRRHSAGRPVRTESTPHPPWPPAPFRPPAAPPAVRPAAPPAPRSRARHAPWNSPRCTARSSASPCPPSSSAPNTASSPARDQKASTRLGGDCSPAASCGCPAGSPSPSRAAWRPPTGRSSSAFCASPEKPDPTPASPSNGRGAPTAPSGSPCGAPSAAPSGSRWSSLWARISRTWARWRPAGPDPSSRQASTEPDCAGPEATAGRPPSPRTRHPWTPWRRRESCAGRPSWLPEPLSRSGSAYEGKPRPAPRAPRARGPADRVATSSPRRGPRPTTRAPESCCVRPSKTCGPCSSAPRSTPRTCTSPPVSPGAADRSPPRRSGRPGWPFPSAPGSPPPPSAPSAAPNSPAEEPNRAVFQGLSGTPGPAFHPAARASRPRSPFRPCSPRPAAGGCRRRTWRSCCPSRNAASTGCAASSARTVSCRTRDPPDPGGPRRRRTRTGRRCSARTSSTPAEDPAVTHCVIRRGHCGSGSGARSGPTTVRAAPSSPVRRTAGPGADRAVGRHICSTPGCWVAAGTRRACWTRWRPNGWPGCSAPRPSTPAGGCAA